MEVAVALGGCPGVVEASVYGVSVPGEDGRAGMAAVTVSGDFHLAALHAAVTTRLPAYARPLFLRIVASFARTETLKQKKTALAAEGFDPTIVSDPLYIDRDGAYRPLDAEVYAAIGSVEIQL
ncbi:MAG: AMP-binding enzyme [Bosea sp. (in: a-proteobacteria)]